MQDSQETQVRSLGREDPLEKAMVTHSSILAWKNLMDRGAWWVTDCKESDKTECKQMHTQTHTHLLRIQPRTPDMVVILNTVWRILQKHSLRGFQFSYSVVSDSLRPNGLQHARPPCPSPTPKACKTHVH